LSKLGFLSFHPAISLEVYCGIAQEDCEIGQIANLHVLGHRPVKSPSVNLIENLSSKTSPSENLIVIDILPSLDSKNLFLFLCCLSLFLVDSGFNLL
jgi:hypothetical protein